MSMLPNEEITKKHLEDYSKNYQNEGVESLVLHMQNPNGIFVRKIFRINKEITNLNFDDETLEKRENKMQKIIKIHQKKKLQNNVRILKSLTINGILVGYDTTLDYNDSTLDNNCLNADQKRFYLEAIKIILEDFHENEIVYGDIKPSNILINLKEKRASFCDLDNTQVEKYPIDIFREGLSYFRNEQKLVPENSDAYMYNFLLLNEFLECYHSKKTLKEKIMRGYFPEFLDSNAKNILDEMIVAEENGQYSGEYLLKYLKK